MMTPADGEAAPAAATVDVTPAPASAAAVVADSGPWYGDLPETNDDEKGFKQWVEKKNWKDPLSALKSARELEKHVGANRVVLPDANADITQWEGFDKLGVPKEAKDYKVDRPTLPEGMTWNESLEGQVKEAAAKMRIHPTQLKGLVDVYTQAQVAQFNEAKAFEAKDAEAIKALHKEWGADADTNKEFVRRGAKFLGLNAEEVGALADGLMGNPPVLKALLKFGKMAREGSTVDGDTPPVIGLEALKADLARINERLGKGETLTAEEMKKRTSLYSQIAAQGGF